MPATARSLVLLAALTTSSAALAGGPEGVALRIATLNVKEGVDASGTSTFNATGAFMTTNDVDGPGPNSGLMPDLVAIQEARSDFDNLAFRDQFLPGYTYHRVTQVDAGGNFNFLFVRPDIAVLDVDQYYIGGPRNMLRVTLDVPGAANLLTVYVVHFKAFSDSSSVNQRRTNANESGIAVYNDLTQGLDLDDNGSRETPAGNAIFLGDLNSNNNLDQTLNGLFTHVVNGMPTGLKNLPVESLFGRTIGGAPIIVTFPSSSSRLDYICLDQELADQFDTDLNGAYSQDEINAMGFVYYSGDDNGAQSNGNTTATSFATDHRPVVFDVVLPAEPVEMCVGDLDGDLDVDFADLNMLLGEYNQAGQGLAGDLDGDEDVDFADLNMLLGVYNQSC